MIFEELNPKIREWLKKQGYLEGSLPQKLAIPEIKDGKDVLIIAPTGHGKTLAAILPVFDKLLHEISSEGNSKGIKLLYLTPLKSLNRDILDRIITIATHIGLEVDLRHGDTPQKVRAQQLADPADVLISTPETLQAILTAKKFRELLRTVKYVVVDEIHELCENKRGSQLTVALERLELLTRKPFQRIGISATIGEPDKISKYLTGKKCSVVDARAEKEYSIKVEHPNPEKQDEELAKKLNTLPNVAYCLRRIKELVEKSKSALIFVNTRETAESLGAKFRNWVPDFPIAVHHSSLSKDVRVDVEDKFKRGELKAIISTSSLELGIDVGSIDLVVQYGSPRQATKLIQRVGRSGHGIGRISKGIIICGSIDDYLEASAIIKKSGEKWLESTRIPEKPFDVLAHQIVGICMDYQNNEKIPTRDEIYKIVTKAYPYKNMTFAEFEDVIELMKEIHLLGEREEGLYRTKKGLLYYFENLSTIPTEKNYDVIASDMNKRIGVLHQGFVAEHVQRNAEFIMKGEPWKVVEKDENKVIVVSSSNKEGAIPSWEGELIPVPMEVASTSGDLREKYEFDDLKIQKEKFVVPTSRNMYIESFENYVIVHSCFGSKVNQTLSKAIAAIISSKIGSSIGVRNDAYRMLFKMPELFGQETIIDCINELQPEWIQSIITKSLKNSAVFGYRFYQIAKRFGIIEKHAEYSQYMISKITDVYQNTPVYLETVNELFREKLDIENAMAVLEKIKSGKIKLVTSTGYEVSPLGAAGLNYNSVSLIKPKDKIREIYELVKQRLLKRRFWFSCLKCENHLGTFTSESVPEDLKCTKCGAKLIGFIPVRDMELARKVLKKHFKKEKLDDEERKLLKTFTETGELFINYGKKAVFVMAGYGVGPTAAKRILGKFHKTDDELVKDIVATERNFIENRMFWQTKPNAKN